MLSRRGKWLACGLGILLAFLLAGAGVLTFKLWPVIIQIRQMSRIITAFDDSRLDASEIELYRPLLARVPEPERERLFSALGRFSRGELRLEKIFTEANHLPILIVAPPGSGPFPALIFIHGAGGAGVLGKETAIPFFAELAGRGYLMAAFDTRCFGERGGVLAVVMAGKKGIYPKIVIPTARQDVFEVAACLQKRGDVIKDQMGLFGYSMGGLITLGAGAQDKNHVFKALVCAAGGANYDAVVEALKATGRPAPELPESVVQQIREFDPFNHLNAFCPAAIMLIHGRNDMTAPFAGVQSFYDALRPLYAASPERLKLVVVDGDHDLYPTWMEDALGWFDRFLAEKPLSAGAA
jgi:dienelactone hydrolase